MEGAVEVELMATEMGRQTGKLSRKLPSSAIWRPVMLCSLFHDAVSIQELHDINKKKIVNGSLGCGRHPFALLSIHSVVWRYWGMPLQWWVLNIEGFWGPTLIFVRVSLSRSQRPRGLIRRSPTACLLILWVRIPQWAWMFVCCECCVLSLRWADHSSRGVLPTVVCRCVWSRNFMNEEALTRWGLLCQKKSRYQWQRGLRRWSAATHLLGLWIRIPPGAWIYVCC